MTIYILALFINLLAGVALVSRFKNGKKTYLWFTFVELTLLGGLRSINVGTDTSAYHDIFNSIAKIDTLQGLFDRREELGYVLLNKLLSALGGDAQMLIFVCSMFIAGGFILFIAKISDHVIFSVFLLFTLMMYLSSFNIVRQFMATVIILNGFSYLKEKKLVKYGLVCVVAWLFHSTSIIWIVLGIVPLIKWNANKTALYLGILLFAVVMAPVIIKLIILILPQYSGYLSTGYFQPSGEEMPIVVNGAIIAFLTFVIAIARPYQDKTLIYTYVISVLAGCLTLIAATTASMANRFSYYVIPFMYISIPRATAYLPKTGQTWMQILIGIAGCAYYIYCLYLGWAECVPYEFFWMV